MVIAGFDDFPVDDLPEGGEMGGAAILVIQIVCVFPDVEGEEGVEAFGDGVVGAGFLGDDQSTVFLCGEPYPAAAEEGDAFGFELGFEGVEGAPLLLDLSGKRSRVFASDEGFAARARGTELGEIEVVVEYLAGIVENGAFGVFHNVFEGQLFHSATGEEFVEVIDVALEVFAVVVFEGLLAYYRRQGVDVVG